MYSPNIPCTGASGQAPGLQDLQYSQQEHGEQGGARQIEEILSGVAEIKTLVKINERWSVVRRDLSEGSFRTKIVPRILNVADSQPGAQH